MNNPLRSLLQRMSRSSKNSDVEPTHLPFLRKVNVRTQYVIASSLTVFAVLGAISVFNYTNERAQQLNARSEYAVNIKMLSQRLAKNIQLALAGNEPAFGLIQSDTATLNSYITKFKDGDNGADFSRLEPALQETIVAQLSTNYAFLAPRVQLLQSNKMSIVDISKRSTEYDTKIQNLVSDLNLMYLLMYQRGTDASKLTALQSLSTATSNFNKNLSTAANSLLVELKLVSDLSSDYQTIVQLIKSLTVTEALEDTLVLKDFTAVAKNNEAFLSSMPAVLNNIKPLIDGKRAGSETLNVLDTIYTQIDALKTAAQTERSTLSRLELLGVLFGALTLLLVFLIGYINLKEAQIRAWVTNKENEETDAAVISLMEELTPISEGNLKARATITEHVTGSLGDKINQMAESLQSAVKKTRETSEKVSHQMVEVTALINSSYMLSKEAEEQARISTKVSIAGVNVVNSATEKMEDARVNMQETSKRVKRLGEVSQSIGLVTDLIEEMTEKTAILALNTQLKAAESGSEGNTFRVIAEEIRKLSDDSKKSLATIRSNVESMQSETQTLMMSIEQTTANVVAGSALWVEAENNLKLIQNSAAQIEQVTEKLNALSTQQVSKAKNTETNMQELNASIAHFTV